MLEEECNYQNNILSLFLKTKGDFILVCTSHIVSSFTQYHTVERLCKGYLRTSNCTGTCMYVLCKGYKWRKSSRLQNFLDMCIFYNILYT